MMTWIQLKKQNKKNIPFQIQYFFLDPTTPTEVYEVINGLRLVWYPNNILKYNNIISQPLSSIISFKSVIWNYVYSKKLKNTLIKPIYKKGDKAYITNYHHIALILALKTIFERVILSQN